MMPQDHGASIACIMTPMLGIIHFMTGLMVVRNEKTPSNNVRAAMGERVAKWERVAAMGEANIDKIQ
jgi:hypothetical protein